MAMNLDATMHLENQGFVKPLEAAGKAMDGLKGIAGSLAGPLAALGVSFAAFKSLEGVTEGLKGVFEMGKELKSQASITGQSVRDIVILRKAFAEAGLDAGGLTGSLAMMQNALGGVNEMGEPTKHIFDQLGLSIANLKGQTAVQQFQAIGSAISKLGDQESKMAAVRGIFGRQGAQMLALFNDPKAIGEATRLAKTQADVYQRSAVIFAEVANAFEAISGKVKGFFVGLAAGIAPVLLPLLEKLKSINTVKIGESIGNVVKAFGAAFKSGGLSDLIGLSIKAGAEIGVNAFSGLMKGLGELLGQVAAVLGEGSFWAGMKDGFISAVNAMAGALVTAFDGPLKAIQDSFTYLSERVAAGPTGGKKMKIAEGLDAEVSRLKKIRDDYLSVGDKTNAAGAQKSITATQQRRLDLGYVPRSLEQISKEDKFSLGGISSSDLNATASEYAKKAANDANELMKTNVINMGEVWKKFNEAAKGGGPAMQELKKSLEAWSKSTASTLAESGQKTGTDKLADVRGKIFEGDRLAKLGGFVGNATPSAMYDRQTAENTNKLVNHMQVIVNWIGARPVMAGLPYQP